MAFDGIVTKSIVSELNELIIGGKINKIYEPTKNEIVLDIYNKKKFMLNICIDSSNCRINLTNHIKENPKQAPNFCMLLRKYLTSSKITSIETLELDRIVVITLENYNELNDVVRFKLIVELMGKHSNIILVNNRNIVIDSIRRIASEQATRTILPANPYILPTSDKFNLLKMSKEEFVNKINSEDNKNLINICTNNFMGISKSFITFTLEKLKIDSNNYNKDDLEKLYKYIIDILTQKNIGCEEFELNNKKDFTVSIVSSSLSINSFVDEFYFNKENEELFVSYRNNVLKLILSLFEKYNKKLLNIQEKLIECNDMDKYKLYGELITSNLYRINNNINLDNIELENYYDNNNLISIPLDKKVSPSLNAKKYFKKYNKLKSTLEIVTKQKSSIVNEIDYLESIIYSINSAHTINEVDEIYLEIQENVIDRKINTKQASKNIDKPSSPISLSIDGYNVLIGKNNKQNDLLTFKLSSKNDLWFHAKDIHGSHVVLKLNDANDISDNLVKKCASIAAYHSKAKDSTKILVEYTYIKNIKKPKGSKPGFVTLTNYKTILVKPCAEYKI